MAKEVGLSQAHLFLSDVSSRIKMNKYYLKDVLIRRIDVNIVDDEVIITGSCENKSDNVSDFEFRLTGPFEQLNFSLLPGGSINALAIDDLSERGWERTKFFLGDPEGDRLFIYASHVAASVKRRGGDGDA